MKVLIKVKKVKFTLPLPVFLFGFIIKHIPNKEITEEMRIFIIDSIKCVEKNLKEYKGVKIVEIETNDGYEVTIIA